MLGVHHPSKGLMHQVRQPTGAYCCRCCMSAAAVTSSAEVENPSTAEGVGEGGGGRGVYLVAEKKYQVNKLKKHFFQVKFEMPITHTGYRRMILGPKTLSTATLRGCLPVA